MWYFVLVFTFLDGLLWGDEIQGAQACDAGVMDFSIGWDLPFCVAPFLEVSLHLAEGRTSLQHVFPSLSLTM